MTRNAPGASRTDADGVRTFEHSGLRWTARLFLAASLTVVVAIVAGVIVLRHQRVGRHSASEDSVAPSAADERAGIDTSPRPTPAPTVGGEREKARVVRRLAAVDEAPGERAPGAKEPEIKASDIIPLLRAEGANTGIALFPPPGTKPVQRGIVVPDDFELPEGFVRHYQTTDDGHRLAPILTLHPDYDLVDPSGNPIALPDDRVVPPELAPPGMPIRMLKLPRRDGRGGDVLP